VSRPAEWLFELLPAFLRKRDFERGGPLRALMSVLEMQHQAIESDLDQLYENWFVETCEEWVLPYIGDLLGLRALSGARPEVFSLRGRVGHAMAWRRRKGTLAALAGAVREGTGWSPHVVRYRDRTAMSWPVKEGGEPARAVGATNLDLRSLGQEPAAQAALEGPWSTAARTAAVSGLPADPGAPGGVLAERGGRFSPAALGVYLWRLQYYPVRRGAARPLARNGTRFTTNPFGIDQPLYWLRPVADAAVDETGETSVPDRLARSTLAALATADAMGDDETPRLLILVSEQAGQAFAPVSPADLLVADLTEWRLPPEAGSPRPRDPRASGAPGGRRRPPRVTVDPELGRLLFATENAHREVRVSCGYGASADIGGGGYPRHSAPLETGGNYWEAAVSRDAPQAALPAEGPFERKAEAAVTLYRSVQHALAAWIDAAAAEPAGARQPTYARVRILDSALYDVGALPLALPPGTRRLVIEAGAGECPCLVGDISLRTLGGDDEERAEVLLSGLWWDGRVSAGGALTLRLEHCTLRSGPGDGSPAAAAAGCIVAHAGDCDELSVAIRSSLMGPVLLPTECRGLEIADSVLDAGGDEARALGGPATTVVRSTIFGATAVAHLQAASCLFTGRIQTYDAASGWVRACYIPPGSVTPVRASCQPPSGAGDTGPTDLAAYAPRFTSRRLGDPGYAQLARSTPPQISAGGEDGAEMGVFQGLYQPQRLSNLPLVLEEFVPWGCEVFVELMT
jgi:hypothetical protein